MTSGVLAVDKPAGWRSRQVVDAIGKHFGQRKIGHAGTLDPGATGLLLLLLGEATKLSNFLMDGRKVYRATIRLGEATDTHDADGEILARTPIDHLDGAAVTVALDAFRGTILQRPPEYAAIKIAGRPAYKYARAGQVVALEPRPVTIYSLRVLRIALPDVEIEVECGKGTYIRSIARDLGETLGVGGHLIQIARIASAPFHLRDAHTIDQLLELPRERLRDVLVPVEKALPGIPRIDDSGELASRVRNGQALPGEALYGRLPPELKRGDVVQIVTPDRVAVLEVGIAPADLGPPPWRGTAPLRYLRVLHRDAAAA